jgi:DNA repair exonuclease SbcCD ATPase subunit
MCFQSVRLKKLSQITTIAGCAAALLCAVPLLATQPQPSAAAGYKPADKLLLEMKTDAQTIESHATELERLTKDPNSRWAQFDTQWNEIKPAQEALHVKLEKLESMRGSLSDQQRKAVDDSKQAMEIISARTSQLLQLIDQPGAGLKSLRLRSDAQSLAESAKTVARVSAAGA